MGSLAELSRPRTTLDCLYPAAEVAALRAWMAGGATGPALATAAPGSGLTTLLSTLVRETAMDAVWVGCATPRVKELLRQAGSSPVSVTLRRKIIVVDEFDAFGGGDASALADALAFAKAGPPLPVLFASHSSRSQKSLEYAKAWPRFELGRPSAPALKAYLRAVCARHGVAADDALVARVVAATKGDLRAALMTLDALRIGAPADGMLRADAGDVERHAKDEAADALDIVESLLRGERGADLRDCLKLYHTESAVVPMGLYENYPASLGADDTRAAAAAADSFSVADRVDRYLYSHQAWDAVDVYAAAAVAGPVLHMRRLRRSPPSPAFAVTKFGSVWSRMYNMYAKMKHVRALALARAERGLTRLDAADLALVRRMLRAALEAGDAGALSRCCSWMGPALTLQLARLQLGPAWYRQMHHTRVKRALAGG